MTQEVCIVTVPFRDVGVPIRKGDTHMLLTRTTPRDGIDRAFQHLTSSLFTTAPSAWRTGPTVQGAWRGEELELTVDLPGVPRDAVAVEVADRSVTITVEHNADHEQMRWSRTFTLGGSLDADRVAARYADGRLTVTVPPVSKSPARRIELTEGPATAVGTGSLETGSTDAVAADTSRDDG
jgi:HSP20 family protein